MKLLALLVVASLAAGCTLPWPPRQDGPGDAAHDLVSGAKYPKLLVEIDHPPNAGPHAAALDVLRATLREVTGKSSIDVEVDASIPSEPNKKYTFEEIERLEEQHRDHQTRGDTAVLYVLYVAGGSSGDSDDGVVLGAVYAGTSIVMFKGNIRSSSGGGPLSSRPPEEVVERAVLVHEFGHAAGLVNLGAPMQRPHEDPENQGHSSNRNSVMYWAVESSAGLALLCQLGLGTDCGVPYQFDADDKADLRALREAESS